MKIQMNHKRGSLCEVEYVEITLDDKTIKLNVEQFGLFLLGAEIKTEEQTNLLGLNEALKEMYNGTQTAVFKDHPFLQLSEKVKSKKGKKKGGK